MALRLRGRLDTGALRAALPCGGGRHESLPTLSAARGGSAQQVVLPAAQADIGWDMVDAGGWTAARLDAAVGAATRTGSCVHLTAEAQNPRSVYEITAAFAVRADLRGLAGTLAYSDEPLVSSDIVKSPFSSIFDSGLTSVLDGSLVKVVAWYDNEWGYSNRVVELAEKVLVRAHA